MYISNHFGWCKTTFLILVIFHFSKSLESPWVLTHNTFYGKTISLFLCYYEDNKWLLDTKKGIYKKHVIFANCFF